MQSLRMFRALGPIDVRSVWRDSMLRWMVVLPLVVALACRFILPLVLQRVERELQLSMLIYYPVVASSALLMIAPAMIGMLVGFLLLDQRDDRTLVALQVTPLPLTTYLTYRISVPVLISIAMSLVSFPIAGLTDLGAAQIFLVAVSAAPLAPLAALALAAFAENKVQGIALTKLASFFMIAPMAIYFVPAHWQIIFGILPTYFPAKLYWLLQAGDTSFWLYFLAGLAYQALLLVLLLRRFIRIIYS